MPRPHNSRKEHSPAKEDERVFHNKLDNSERRQAEDFLNEMHRQVDQDISAAAKRALLQVDGDPMVPSRDSLTSQEILSAGPNATMNPRHPSSSPSSPRAPDPARLDKLIRALRSRCQSLSDGGKRFHEVFDMLDARDTGEISGLGAIVQALGDLGIKGATRQDGEALLAAFSGTDSDRMSYRKFLQAVMLGNTSRQRTAEILANLHWQLSSEECVSAAQEFGGTPLQVLTSVLADADDDGSGTAPRAAFRDALAMAFESLAIPGLEEGDLRRVMDKFSPSPDEDEGGVADDRVNWNEFTKVLRADAGSPSKKGGGGRPLEARVKEAMQATNVDAVMLRDQFLPTYGEGEETTCIEFSEVEQVTGERTPRPFPSAEPTRAPAQRKPFVPSLPLSKSPDSSPDRSYSRQPAAASEAPPDVQMSQEALEYMGHLKAENDKLKQELSSFDSNFFEEVEDLKSNYARLKKVALEQAAGGGGNAQFAGTTSNEAVHDSDPFDDAPPRQMAEMMDRADRLSGGMGVPLSPRLSPRQQAMYRPKKKKGRKSNKYGNDHDYWNARGGVVGAHERKLAWQISGGGFEALEEAEKWIRRMDRNGDSYLSGKQLAAALREAGYDLTDGDVQLVLNGFGSDEYGRVDVEEFLQAMQDIASGNDWYHKNHRIPGLSKTTSALAEPPSVARSGEFMHGTVFNGLAGGYEGKWDSFDAAREPSLVESALEEVIEQMALIDVSRLPGYGNGNRAAAIMHPFRHMDRGRKGVISISDFAACVEALGLVLTAGEVRALAHQFSVQDRAAAQNPNSPTKSGAFGVEYPPFVRFLLEASTMNRWTGDGADDWGKAEGDEWWEVVPKIASKVKKARKKARSKSKWLKTVKTAWKKAEVLGDIMQALVDGNVKLTTEDMHELAPIVNGMAWKDFAKVFKKKKDGDDDDSDSDDDDDSGSDSGSSSDGGSDSDDSGRKKKKKKKKKKGSSDDSDKSDGMKFSSLLAVFGKTMMSQSDPRAWLDSVLFLFSEADSAGNGYLEPGEFYHLVKKVGIRISKGEFKEYASELESDRDGRCSYVEILSALLKSFKQEKRKFLAEDREIAEKIMDAMGENPGTRRLWLSKLRKHFFSLDKFRNGTMPGPKLLKVLKELRVKLTKDEEGRLLDALPTVDVDDEGDYGDANGSVSYRELLGFCAAYAGKWYEQDEGLADTLRNALRDNMRKTSWVANLKEQFEDFDANGDGVVSKKEFAKGCKKIGMRVTAGEMEKLMELLDKDGSGDISYGDFVAFFNASSSKGSWFDDEPEIAKKLREAVSEGRRGGGEESVFAFRDECTKADESDGFLDTGDFRKNVVRCFKVKLSEKEVSRLSTALDSNGDGQIAYFPVLEYLIACLPGLSERSPSEFRAVQKQIQKSKGGKRGAISSIEERCKVCDRKDRGFVSVKEFHGVLMKCGVRADPKDLETLANGIDRVRNGSMFYEVLLDELKGSQSYGREEWYEREASLAQRLRKAVWSWADKSKGGSKGGRGGKSGGRWQKDLRAAFEHFDRDGDGVVSSRDFGRAMSSLKIKFGGADSDRLMELLDKSGDGMISYEDFVDFMVSGDEEAGGGAGRGRGRGRGRDDDSYGNDDDSRDDEDDRSRSRSRGGKKSAYRTVVGEYDEQLSPRSRSPRGGRGGGRSRSKSPRGGKKEMSSSRGDAAAKELLKIREKILDKLSKGEGSRGQWGKGGEKKLLGVFKDMDRRDSGFVSGREFDSAMKKVGVVLQRNEKASLLKKFDTEDDGKFDYKDFVLFVFNPEKRRGGGGGGGGGRGYSDEEDDDSYVEERRGRGRGGGRGGAGGAGGGGGAGGAGGRPVSRKAPKVRASSGGRGRRDDHDDDSRSRSDDESDGGRGLGVRGTSMKKGSRGGGRGR
ncbi:hypothetical protein TeGR_g8823 [Tetraparma gracilis]|uniref:EF-hand domain-containing protein n=1 Tax=Tetraparma gracilis TaxID=2962635 RepID=A0ABQ6MXX2_9STRA|nr:hypothetical protein TeGR_g8823 [Tetraparma gracilis]